MQRESVLLAGVIFAGILAYRGNIALASVAGLFTLIFVEAYQSNNLPSGTKLFEFLSHIIPTKKTAKNKVRWQNYKIILGRDVDTREIVAPLLDVLGSCGVACQTRFGKTTFLHSVLYNLIKYHRPNQLKLAIVDPEGFDFRLFAKVPHLFRPIASKNRESAIRLIQDIYDEMDKRGELFDSLAGEFLCNDIQRYHALIEHHGLDLPHLPYILFLFDEIQEFVTTGTPEEEMLKKIAKRGQKRGIFFMPATQRPTANIWSGELKSQLTSVAIGYMSSNFEYGVIAKVPKEIYERMEYVKGRFATLVEGRWFIMQGQLIDDEELARFLKSISNDEEPTWPTPLLMNEVMPEREKLSGSRSQKIARVKNWIHGRATKERPTAAEFMSQFDVSENTALRWINEVYGE